MQLVGGLLWILTYRALKLLETATWYDAKHQYHRRLPISINEDEDHKTLVQGHTGGTTPGSFVWLAEIASASVWQSGSLQDCVAWGFKHRGRGYT